MKRFINLVERFINLVERFINLVKRFTRGMKSSCRRRSKSGKIVKVGGKSGKIYMNRYFVPFHTLKTGINFGRFDRLMPHFSVVEHRWTTTPVNGRRIQATLQFPTW